MSQPSKEKVKLLDDALAGIEKKHGEGSILKMGAQVGKVYPHIPTGIYEIDHHVLGIGGVPKGRIIEVVGAESSGKTTLCLSVVASSQQAGGQCAFVDAEHALDPTWAALNGVDVDALVVSQPDSGEQALAIVEDLVRSEAVDVIVVDSVAALVPQSELNGELGDSHVGLQARLMSQAMRMLAGIVSKTNTTVIFVNQIREKIGVTYGSPETTSGGRALKFYASVRLDVRRVGSFKLGETIIGNKVKVKAVKNKMAPPFREAIIDLLFEEGFDKLGSLVDAATAKGILTLKGSWYSMGDTKIGQGRDSARKLLATHPEIKTKIEAALKAS